MGAQNRITREKYEQIKAECKSPRDDLRAMQKYHVSKSTIRSIRNSESYDFYRLWVAGKIHKNLIDVEPPRVHVKPEINVTPRIMDFHHGMTQLKMTPNDHRKINIIGHKIMLIVFFTLNVILDVILIILLLNKLTH